MIESEVIAIALTAINGDTSGLKPGPPDVIYKKRHMSLGKNRSGWLVTYDLDEPPTFEPHMLMIEVYEDDLSTHVRPVM
jgi:hypothetical protein